MASLLNGSIHRMLHRLVRRTWLLTVIAVALCAGFAAHAASALVDARYLTDSTDAASPRPVAARVAPPGPGPRRSEIADAQLVERNMFCSTCPLAGAADAGAFSGIAAPAVTSAVLIAIDVEREPRAFGMIAEGTPRATVRVVASDVQGSWGVGEDIPGVGRIDAIGRRSIDLTTSGGRRGKLSLLDGVPGLDAAATASAANALPALPDAAPWADRIRKIDEQTYEVERGLVRELVSAGATPGGPRFIPLVNGGKVSGARLFGVRPDSIPAALGLKNGDVLSTADGTPLTNVNQLLDLYVKLDQLSNVELAGTRAGKPLVRTLRLK